MSQAQQPLFKTLKEEKKEIDPKIAERANYETFKVNNLVDKDTFQGEIYLSDIYENEFPDDITGEMVKTYSAGIYISNDENQETLKGKVNLKGLNDNIQVWQGSMAYDLIDSLKELHEPGTGGINNIYKMSFKELQTHINQLGTVLVEVKGHTGDFDYNTLRIIGVN